MRMQMRRFTRLTNALSKKVENNISSLPHFLPNVKSLHFQTAPLPDSDQPALRVTTRLADRSGKRIPAGQSTKDVRSEQSRAYTEARGCRQYVVR